MKFKIKLLPILALFVSTITACKKEGDLVPVIPIQAGLNVINAGTDTVNIFQNGTRLNNTSVYFPGGTLGYLSISSGEQSFQIKRAGTPTVFLDTKYTLKDSTFNSLFIAGTAADKTFLIEDAILREDTLAQVRFVNASPDASYDVKIGAGFTYANQAFKAATPFVTVPVGNNVLTIYPAGSTTPLVTRTLVLVAGKAYTVYTRGKVGGTAPGAFAATLITNL